MLRRLLAAVVHLFFRRVSVVGAEHVPARGPVMLVLNHPNALVDPVLLLALAPRRVVFLAKEPLFRMPLIGFAVRRFGSIPLYRRQDQADMTRNRESFARVWAELTRGGAIAIFPEGTSHSDARLRPFKTGAARMALGAAAHATASKPIEIVPTGLYYTAKGRFRSSVLLSFGAPIRVDHVPLDADGEPPAEPVRCLTMALEQAVTGVTLQADRHEALRLVARVERIFSSGAAGQHPDLPDQFAIRQRLLAGYAELERSDPALVAALEHRVARYEAALAAAGIAPENVSAGPIAPGRAVRFALWTVGWSVVAAPVAGAGIVLHLPAYWLTAAIARGAASRSPDVVATIKIGAALVCYPLTWLLSAVLVAHVAGNAWGLVTLLVAPVSGLVALRFLERLDRFVAATRAVALAARRPVAYRRLMAQRNRIRTELTRLAEHLPAGSPPGAGVPH